MPGIKNDDSLLQRKLLGEHDCVKVADMNETVPESCDDKEHEVLEGKLMVFWEIWSNVGFGKKLARCLSQDVKD